MRTLKVAVLAGALSLVGFGFASPASACKEPVNNNNSCQWGGCRLVLEQPDPNTLTWAAPYFECYY
ncbi:MAG TPA: hypothetical protein VHI71_04305 [Actinomycetota bacterium]|nr:hypothetical protein [Actinomycetota bacterium]